MLDFESFSETVTFNVGDTVGDRRCINVTIRSDTEVEGNETLFVKIFLTTLDSQVEIDVTRKLKIVIIVDGECSTTITSIYIYYVKGFVKQAQ